jgi:hypothetical protein
MSKISTQLSSSKLILYFRIYGLMAAVNGLFGKAARQVNFFHNNIT